MVSINLVYWRRMTPADRLLSESIEGMFSHCAEYIEHAKIENEEKYDRGRNDDKHRNDQFQSQFAKPTGF